MKLFYYVVIFTGIMLLFNLAGIDTASHQILSSLGVSSGIGNSTETSTRTSGNSDIDTVIGDIKSVSAWGKFAIMLAIFGVLLLLTAKFGILSSVVPQIPIEVGFGFISLGVGALFAADMWSIFTNPALDSIYWVKWIIGAIIVPLAIGFFITLVEFVRGND